MALTDLLLLPRQSMSSPPAVLDVPDAKPVNLVAAWKKGQDAAAAASAPLNQCSALNPSLKEKLITEFTDEFKQLEHGRQQVLAAALCQSESRKIEIESTINHVIATDYLRALLVHNYTDLKEWAALIRVFPGVVLSVVTGKSAESVEVKARLRLVEEKLGEACILDDTGVFHRHYRGRDAGFDSMDGNVAWNTGRERTPSIFPAQIFSSLATRGSGFAGGCSYPRYLNSGACSMQNGITWRMDPFFTRGRIAFTGQKEHIPEELPPVAFFVPDASRHGAAIELLENNQISTPTFDAGTFSFCWYSSLATEFHANQMMYEVEIRTNGTASRVSLVSTVELPIYVHILFCPSTTHQRIFAFSNPLPILFAHSSAAGSTIVAHFLTVLALV
ncbi:hypothetical protein B0H13DRAFT_1903729 [Mycena leptocephala]|nr:hypothetical protein B0H13DRAFT_1903729 [Mycena leptocephala]